MKYLRNIGISAITTLVLLFIIHNFIPISVIEKFEITNKKLGATITTILGTDRLSDSRTVINTNFANLNSDKIEDDVATLSSLTSIGIVDTGTWNADILTVAYGGTGSSTLSANQVLLGNGTTQLDVVVGFGTSGQFLTSNGAATAPTWETSAVALGDDYTWTGTHIFNTNVLTVNAGLNSTATTTIAASSVLGNALVLNSIAYAFPSSDGASTTALMTNGSGGLSWNTIQTIVNTDVPKSVGSAGTLVTQNTANQVGAAFSLKNSITITKVSVNVTAVGTAGTVNFAIYSEDGQTRHFSTTTTSISGTGLHEMTLGTPDALTLDAGYYYFAASEDTGATDVTFTAYIAITGNIAEGGSGDSHLQGRFGNGAASLPATFDPTSDLTNDAEAMIQFRFN